MFKGSREKGITIGILLEKRNKLGCQYVVSAGVHLWDRDQQNIFIVWLYNTV